VGISDNMDIGGFWTTAPEAITVWWAGEFKYAMMQESGNILQRLYGQCDNYYTEFSDFNIIIYSVDLIASKSLYVFTPYIGLKTSLIVGTETTSKVDLKKESIPIARDMPEWSIRSGCSTWQLNITSPWSTPLLSLSDLSVSAEPWQYPAETKIQSPFFSRVGIEFLSFSNL